MSRSIDTPAFSEHGTFGPFRFTKPFRIKRARSPRLTPVDRSPSVGLGHALVGPVPRLRRGGDQVVVHVDAAPLGRIGLVHLKGIAEAFSRRSCAKRGLGGAKRA